MKHLRFHNPDKLKKKFLFSFQCLVVATCVLYLAIASLFSATIGRADQGDWIRCFGPYVSKPFGFDKNRPDVSSPQHDDRFFKYWIPFWNIGEEKGADFSKSSTHLLLAPGFELNKLFFSDNILDIRFISIVSRVVTFTIFMFFLYLFGKYNRPNAILFVIVGITFIFSDLYYTSYFNTFYQESGSFTYAALSVCSLFILMTGHVGLTILTFVLANALLITAKTQHIGIFVSCVITLIILLSLYKKYSFKVKLMLFVMSILILAGSSVYTFKMSSGSYIMKCNAYHRLFRGVLEVSDKPVQILKCIGLNPDDAKYIGTSPWNTKTVNFFYKNDFPFSDFAAAVYSDPVVIPRLIYVAFKNMNRIDSMSGFAVREKMNQSIEPPIGFSVLSHVKQQYGPRGWILILVDIVFFIIGTMFLFIKKLIVYALLIYYSLFSHFMELTVVVFGDGRAAIDKHLYLANVLFDYSAIFVLSAVIAYFEYRKTSEADSPFTIGG